MDFGRALECLRGGGKVARGGWNGEGMWVALSPGFQIGPDRIFSEPIKAHVQASGEQGEFRPYLIMYTAQGDFVSWVASQSDLLAEDWQEVE